MQGRVFKAAVFSSIEFLFLIGLWMLFVSELQLAELAAGVCGAALGAVGDGIVKSKSFAQFRPRLRWLWLFLWEPWYVLKGSVAMLVALLRLIAGKKSKGQFRVVLFHAGGQDAGSAARRALAITEISISPDTIVVGIDRERGFLLLHQISPAPIPVIARRLGAES